MKVSKDGQTYQSNLFDFVGELNQIFESEDEINEYFEDHYDNANISREVIRVLKNKEQNKNTKIWSLTNIENRKTKIVTGSEYRNEYQS
jgi:hypothetical protein